MYNVPVALQKFHLISFNISDKNFIDDLQMSLPK